MLIPSAAVVFRREKTSLSRRVNANSQLPVNAVQRADKLIKKGEC